MRCALPAIAGLMAAVSVFADEPAPPVIRPVRPGPQIGDCLVFREGGEGWLLKAPSYWLKGSVSGLSRQRRMADLCPRIGKQRSAYTQADRLRLAAAMPCVDQESEVGEVDVLRVRLVVQAWETPWSYQHGAVGWLFRGRFLDQQLQKGTMLDLDATWLEPCEADL